MSTHDTRIARRTVLVCGGRDYDDRNLVFTVLETTHAFDKIALLIHGGASGADALAAEWARSAGVPYRGFAAYWQTEGKVAGPNRNRRMLTEGRPNLVVAFPGGAGTADMIRQARAAGVPVAEIKP